jgi:hypothetical protein
VASSYNQRLGHVTRDDDDTGGICSDPHPLIPYRVDLNIPGLPYSAQTSRRAIDICPSFGLRRLTSGQHTLTVLVAVKCV